MLQSHLHSLIAKASQYRVEPDRFELLESSPFSVSVHGANGDHRVALVNGRLACDCDSFATRGEKICAHVLGVEHHYRDRVPAGAVEWPFAAFA